MHMEHETYAHKNAHYTNSYTQIHPQTHSHNLTQKHTDEYPNTRTLKSTLCQILKHNTYTRMHMLTQTHITQIFTRSLARPHIRLLDGQLYLIIIIIFQLDIDCYTSVTRMLCRYIDRHLDGKLD